MSRYGEVHGSDFALRHFALRWLVQRGCFLGL